MVAMSRSGPIGRSHTSSHNTGESGQAWKYLLAIALVAGVGLVLYHLYTRKTKEDPAEEQPTNMCTMTGKTNMGAVTVQNGQLLVTRHQVDSDDGPIQVQCGSNIQWTQPICPPYSAVCQLQPLAGSSINTMPVNEAFFPLNQLYWQEPARLTVIRNGHPVTSNGEIWHEGDTLFYKGQELSVIPSDSASRVEIWRNGRWYLAGLVNSCQENGIGGCLLGGYIRLARPENLEIDWPEEMPLSGKNALSREKALEYVTDYFYGRHVARDRPAAIQKALEVFEKFPQTSSLTIIKITPAIAQEIKERKSPITTGTGWGFYRGSSQVTIYTQPKMAVKYNKETGLAFHLEPVQSYTAKHLM